MRRLLLVLAILVATTVPSRADDFWRQSGESCFFGAAVLGASAAMMLYPALETGVSAVPVATLVIGNSIFGCGLGVLGSVAAYGFGALYDRLAPSDEPAAPEGRRGSET